eukprot:9006541-Pyramimonas_sp.AAC.1
MENEDAEQPTHPHKYITEAPDRVGTPRLAAVGGRWSARQARCAFRTVLAELDPPSGLRSR